jgi:signal transduction histidine kinase
MVDRPVTGAPGAPRVDLESVMDRVGDGILVLDHDWWVLYANASAGRLLGRDGDDLTGKHVWTEFPTAVGSTFEIRYREALATQRMVEFEEYFELLDAWFSIRAYPSPEVLTLVFRDVTHLHNLLNQRRRLLDRLLEAEDRERARIAGDIHDDTAQALAAVSLRLDVLRARVNDPDPGVTTLLDELSGLVGSTTTGLRTLLFGLDPAHPEAPIAESISTHASHLFRGSDVRWSVDDTACREDLPHAERSQALRIVKEALNNVHAHARATEVSVTVSCDEAGMEIVVADDGVAVDPATFVSAPGHRGLATMQDRAEAVGGTCVLSPTRPHGTTVRISVPRVVV